MSGPDERNFPRPPLPPPDKIRTVYLAGIGGTGMGALAGLFKARGYSVRGSDEKLYPPMSEYLKTWNIPVDEGYDPAHLDPPPDLLVIGNACTPSHPEARYARENNLVQCSLPEALAHFFLTGRQNLVVTGTHGKTTTAALLAWALAANNFDPGYLIGGILSNTGVSFARGAPPFFVLEGDEYDAAYFDKRPKFIHYRPRAAILTSIEYDHADIYPNLDAYAQAFRNFVALLPADGVLLVYHGDPLAREVAALCPARVLTYGLTPIADVWPQDHKETATGQEFILRRAEQPLGRISVPLWGDHNLLNALAVCGLALELGLSPRRINIGLSGFQQVKRRQEVLGETGGVTVIDDFAHHPTAVRETLRSLRRRFPNRRLAAAFDPRSNTSRRAVFQKDFVAAFAEADAVFVTEPLRYADLPPENRFSAALLAATLNAAGKTAFSGADPDHLLPLLLQELKPGDVAVLMSNGAFGGLPQKLLAALAQR